WKLFLLAGQGRIDGNAACRQSILMELACCLEERRAGERCPMARSPIRVVLVAQAAFLKSKACKAMARLQLMGRTVGRHVEVFPVIQDFPRYRAIGLDSEHARTGRQRLAGVQQGNRILAGAIGKQGEFRSKAYLAESLAIQA